MRNKFLTRVTLSFLLVFGTNAVSMFAMVDLAAIEADSLAREKARDQKVRDQKLAQQQAETQETETKKKTFQVTDSKTHNSGAEHKATGSIKIESSTQDVLKIAALVIDLQTRYFCTLLSNDCPEKTAWLNNLVQALELTSNRLKDHKLFNLVHIVPQNFLLFLNQSHSINFLQFMVDTMRFQKNFLIGIVRLAQGNKSTLDPMSRELYNKLQLHYKTLEQSPNAYALICTPRPIDSFLALCNINA